MIRPSSLRLFALITGVAVVMSCDAGSPTGLGEIGEPGTDGGTSTPVGGDGRPPVVAIEWPAENGNVNIGDSILVGVRVSDRSGVKSLAITGLKYAGNPDYGTQVVTERYPTVTASFPAEFARTDTVVYRILRPAVPVDTVSDSLVIRAIATDNGGVADTTTRVVRLVKGPRIEITTVPSDSIRAGTQLRVSYTAAHRDGVTSVSIRVRNSAGMWPTPMDTTITRSYSAAEVRDSVAVTIPANAPQGSGRLTVEASALASGYNVPATPVTLSIRSSIAGAPIVRQTVPSRAELGDSVYVDAIGDNGIVNVGVIAISGSDTAVTTQAVAGTPSDHKQWVRLNLPPLMQGRTVSIISFATDGANLRGYSVSQTATTAIDSLHKAHRDMMLVTYGKTFALPRAGLAGDIAVDTARGRVFVSNAVHNRVELWRRSTGTFDPVGVRAGAEPWGMTLAAGSNDVLLVANSGGTNISRINIAASDVSSMAETRLLTRNTVAYTLKEVRDEDTGKIRQVLGGPFSYSDRPQYIAQAASGRIYYSTRPTATAPTGTLRYIDPADPVPDSRQVFKYGTRGPAGQVTIFNVDSMGVFPAPTNSPESDLVVVCDHNTGTSELGACGRSRAGIDSAVADLLRLVPNSDIDVSDVDIGSLGLTDTTFVAWSADREWIAFGEGNRGTGARVMMVNDTLGTHYRNIFFSPGIAVADLVENASEDVFGLALDSTGRMLAVHGKDSYFAAVDRAFHLRLQGRYDTPDAGAGITYHPLANIDPSTPGPENTRLVFVASADGTIDIVDAYYFRSRGRIVVKNPLYGPLRASLPMPGDPADVVVKLYGLTQQGLVVIDVTAADIQPLP